MPSVKHNSITAKATGLIFSLFNVASAERCLLAYHSTGNVFFRDLLVTSFVFHSSLLIVNIMVAHDGFL